MTATAIPLSSKITAQAVAGAVVGAVLLLLAWFTEVDLDGLAFAGLDSEHVTGLAIGVVAWLLNLAVGYQKAENRPSPSARAALEAEIRAEIEAEPAP